MYDVIIIGSGPAGMTAAIYCVRKGLKVLVLGKEVGGQVAKSGEIENYLGYWQTTGGELALKFHEHLKEFKNVEHKHDIEVTELIKENKHFKVKTTAGEYKGLTVIIASGRIPRLLNVSGEKEFTNKGVSYCDVCDGPLFKGKDVAIVGGGNSALEAAVSMSVLSPKVYIINIKKELAGDAVLREKVLSLKNVEIINEATTVEIVGDTFVSGLKYLDAKKEEHVVSVKGIFIEIGYIPSINFDKISEKDENNRIKITINCETNIPGIFAAGDVSNIRDNQIVIAAGEGAKAALSAYNYVTRHNAR